MGSMHRPPCLAPVPCSRCRSAMGQTQRVQNAHSIQEWWDCPCCGLTRLHSEPIFHAGAATARHGLELSS